MCLGAIPALKLVRANTPLPSFHLWGSRPGTVGRPQTCGVSLGAVSVATPQGAPLAPPPKREKSTARTPNNTRSQNPHWVRSRGLCLAQHTKATVSNSARRSPQTDSLVVVPPPHETLTLPRPHPHTSSVVVLRMRVTTSVRIRARRVSTCRHPHASATAASLGYHPPLCGVGVTGLGHSLAAIHCQGAPTRRVCLNALGPGCTAIKATAPLSLSTHAFPCFSRVRSAP